MTVDTTLLGETAARCMESLDEKFDNEAVELYAVGIVVVCARDDETWTRTFCSTEIHFEQLGLFQLALDVARTGTMPDEDDGEGP
jgi:hypothetical protein